MRCASLRVLLYELTGIVEEFALHSCIVIANNVIFGYMISRHLI